MSAYDDLLGPDGRGILEQLSPGIGIIPNCPETADVVDDYLLTGEIHGISEDSLAQSFTIRADWIQVGITELVSMLISRGRDHHFVIRGERTPATQEILNTTQFHYFALANIAGVVYVVDSMLHVVRSDVATYVTENHFSRIYYTLNYQSEEDSVL